ncbi:hypothetical protein CC79DRAFT_1325192 [Sarocladium strictum]
MHKTDCLPNIDGILRSKPLMQNEMKEPNPGNQMIFIKEIRKVKGAPFVQDTMTAKSLDTERASPGDQLPAVVLPVIAPLANLVLDPRHHVPHVHLHLAPPVLPPLAIAIAHLPHHDETPALRAHLTVKVTTIWWTETWRRWTEKVKIEVPSAASAFAYEETESWTDEEKPFEKEVSATADGSGRSFRRSRKITKTR